MSFASTAYCGMYWQSHIDSYSESFRLYDLYRDKPDSFGSGKFMYLHFRNELGISHKNFGVAYLQRSDSYLNHSSDAAYLYFLDNQDSVEVEERDYVYSLNMNSVKAEGASLWFKFNTGQNFSSKIFIDIGETRKLMDGNIEGSISYMDEKLIASADIDYQYYRDPIFKRTVNPSMGVLYALGLSFDFHTNKSQHSLLVYDLYSRIDWERAPYTTAQLDTNRIGGINSQGQLTIRPLGSGIEGFREHRQELPIRLYFSNEIMIDAYSLLVNLNHMAELYWLESGVKLNDGDRNMSLLFSFREHGIKFINQASKNFSYTLGVEQLSLKQTHRFLVAFSFKQQ